MTASSLELRSRFERRIFFLQLVAALLLLLLFVRVADLQWLQHEGFLLQAERNRVNVVPILPTRGEITDRNGVGLALNLVSYNLTLIPERVEDMDAALIRIKALMHWSDERMKNLRKRIKRSRDDRPVLLADKLDWEAVSQIAARLHHLPGIDVQAGTHRHYPYGADTSHVVGYVSLARGDDVKAGVLSSEKVGRRGVEHAFEKRLHGELGSQYEEVDAHGRRISAFKRTPSTMGERLQLSLDIRLQQAASKALGKRTGAVVVLDVQSGEILTLLSKPGFEPNRFITGLETEQWQEWINDPQHPLINRTIQAAYPPASTFKLLVGLAALQEGAPLAHKSTQCRGFVELSDRKYRCWKRKGHDKVDMHKAVVESCDVYFYRLGDQLGMPAISNVAQQWGLGQKSGIDIGPEAVGTVPMMGSQQGTRRWYRGDTLITAIGQGSITATPMQMARAVAAIANGGKLLRPLLLAGQAAEIERQIDVKPEQLQTIRSAMRDVVASVHGTAHRAMGRLAWTAAGKTGTAQVVAEAQDDEAQATEKPQKRKHKDHAWFVGYTPYEHPRFAIAVFVEHGGHGSTGAAPVAAAVVRAMAEAAEADGAKSDAMHADTSAGDEMPLGVDEGD